jgi:hypothetical protein
MIRLPLDMGLQVMSLLLSGDPRFPPGFCNDDEIAICEQNYANSSSFHCISSRKSGDTLQVQLIASFLNDHLAYFCWFSSCLSKVLEVYCFLLWIVNLQQLTVILNRQESFLNMNFFRLLNAV